MNSETTTGLNLQQSVPFFAVSDIEVSIHYYVDGLGFEVTQKWIDDGKLRWCWLQRGGASLMLQEYKTEGHDAWIPQCKVGEGVSVYFICEDTIALYREITAHGVKASTPCVGNSMWITGLSDPDGYQLYFESSTDSPEGKEYTDEHGLM